jgi:hypothetical protein
MPHIDEDIAEEGDIEEGLRRRFSPIGWAAFAVFIFDIFFFDCHIIFIFATLLRRRHYYCCTPLMTLRHCHYYATMIICHAAIHTPLVCHDIIFQTFSFRCHCHYYY